jgi:hypothetical protein
MNYQQTSAPSTPKVSPVRKKILRSTSTKAKSRRGVCRFCGCTESRPCVLGYAPNALHSTLEDDDFRDLAITCSWWTGTVCNKATCVETYEALQDQIAKALLASYRAQQKRDRRSAS